MATARGTWKAMERKVARMFGTERNALSGKNAGVSSSDTRHHDVYIECKYSQRIPFMAVYNDTLKKAQKEKKIPIVVFKEKMTHKYMMLIEMQDFLKITDVINNGNSEKGKRNQVQSGMGQEIRE